MSFAQQVRETCLSAFAHQDILFDYLDGQPAQPEGQGTRAAEIRVLFNVLNAPRKHSAFEGLEVSVLRAGPARDAVRSRIDRSTPSASTPSR